jgi:flavin reductase (DIM6/NTAB) family NADH-FMN oxidoreductase RutF
VGRRGEAPLDPPYEDYEGSVQIDVASASVLDVYHLLVGVVTPRPIAWVTTVSPAGVVNLAPFSFFNAFGSNPPVVVFSPTVKRDGTKKDTLRNVEATGEFVVNAAVADLAEQVNLSSKELPPDQSEIELTGLHAVPSVKVRPPRLADSPVNLECRVRQVIPCGTGPMAANLVIGEVVYLHVRDDVLGPTGKPDPRKLRTVARLGGDFWCHTSDLFELKRP